MKRDMDLIRNILLVFDQIEVERLGQKSLASSLDGYAEDQIRFHINLLKGAGYLDQAVVAPRNRDGVPSHVRFDLGYRPTMAGYDFLDSVRDPEVWAKTKQTVSSAGGFTLDLLKELAKGLLKTQIEKLTGVKFT
jgi:hypothetical protein